MFYFGTSASVHCTEVSFIQSAPYSEVPLHCTSDTVLLGNGNNRWSLDIFRSNLEKHAKFHIQHSREVTYVLVGPVTQAELSSPWISSLIWADEILMRLMRSGPKGIAKLMVKGLAENSLGEETFVAPLGPISLTSMLNLSKF